MPISESADSGDDENECRPHWVSAHPNPEEEGETSGDNQRVSESRSGTEELEMVLGALSGSFTSETGHESYNQQAGVALSGFSSSDEDGDDFGDYGGLPPVVQFQPNATAAATMRSSVQHKIRSRASDKSIGRRLESTTGSPTADVTARAAGSSANTLSAQPDRAAAAAVLSPAALRAAERLELQRLKIQPTFASADSLNDNPDMFVDSGQMVDPLLGADSVFEGSWSVDDNDYGALPPPAPHAEDAVRRMISKSRRDISQDPNKTSFAKISRHQIDPNAKPFLPPKPGPTNGLPPRQMPSGADAAHVSRRKYESQWEIQPMSERARRESLKIGLRQPRAKSKTITTGIPHTSRTAASLGSSPSSSSSLEATIEDLRGQVYDLDNQKLAASAMEDFELAHQLKRKAEPIRTKLERAIAQLPSSERASMHATVFTSPAAMTAKASSSPGSPAGFNVSASSTVTSVPDEEWDAIAPMLLTQQAEHRTEILNALKQSCSEHGRVIFTLNEKIALLQEQISGERAATERYIEELLRKQEAMADELRRYRTLVASISRDGTSNKKSRFSLERHGSLESLDRPTTPMVVKGRTQTVHGMTKPAGGQETRQVRPSSVDMGDYTADPVAIFIAINSSDTTFTTTLTGSWTIAECCERFRTKFAGNSDGYQLFRMVGKNLYLRLAGNRSVASYQKEVVQPALEAAERRGQKIVKGVEKGGDTAVQAPVLYFLPQERFELASSDVIKSYVQRGDQGGIKFWQRGKDSSTVDAIVEQLTTSSSLFQLRPAALAAAQKAAMEAGGAKMDKAVERSVTKMAEKFPRHLFEGIIQTHDSAQLRLVLGSDAPLPALDVIEEGEEGQYLIHQAVRSQNAELVDLFCAYYRRNGLNINLKDRHGWTPLHIAASGSDEVYDDTVLRLLLAVPGVDVSVVNQDLNTPVHYFCQRFKSPSSTTDLLKAMLQNSKEVVNQQNRNGETPLHKAIFNDSVRILMVKLLLKHGADPNIQNRHGGDTVLHYAVRLQRKDLVRILLQHGARLDIRETRESKTPRELAQSRNPHEHDPGKNETSEIASILTAVEDLQEWLASLQISELLNNFLKEELFLDTLAAASSSEEGGKGSEVDKILDALHVDQVGVRLRIKQALPRLQEDMSKKKFQYTMLKAEKTSMKLAAPTPEQVQKLQAAIQQNSVGTVTGNDWQINPGDMEFTKELGVGAAGKVFKGLFQGNPVAIKVLMQNASDHLVKEFKKEFDVMTLVRGPKIVHFYGACFEPRIAMVMEYCSRGSLYDTLQRKHKHSSALKEITWERGLSFTRDMATGMQHLHGWDPPVFHRDMKSLNLLVSHDWEVKVCDFGLSRFNTESNQMRTMTKMCGTYAYLAPEMFKGTAFTDKCDVWSCGIVLWEVGNRIVKQAYEAPFHELNLKMDFQILYQVAKKGARPTFSPRTPVKWRELVELCLSTEPSDRPTAAQLVARLNALVAEYAENPVSWLA